MKLKLEAILDFFHLEEALLCAEQSISAGAEVLEIGSSLIKNAGLQSIRIFRERFPDIPLVADLKIIIPLPEELRAASEAGANGITVSGAISLENWHECVKEAKNCHLETFLDYRQLPLPIIREQIRLVKQANYVVLSRSSPDDPIGGILQEIAFHFQRPMVIEIPGKFENFEPMLPLGVAMIALLCKPNSQNIGNTAHSLREAMAKAGEEASEISPHKYSRQNLHDRLTHLLPGQICEVVEEDMLLENLHPIHRFTKVAGQAVTVKLNPGSHSALPKFLLEVPALSIVVLDACGEKNAVWNYLTTVIAIKRKLTAAVVYGAIGDVHLIHSKGFPCYATSLAPANARPTAHAPLMSNVPLRLGHVIVNPGDWLIGDDTGIICVPSGKIFHASDEALALAGHRENLLMEIEKTDDIKTIKRLIEQFLSTRPRGARPPEGFAHPD